MVCHFDKIYLVGKWWGLDEETFLRDKVKPNLPIDSKVLLQPQTILEYVVVLWSLIIEYKILWLIIEKSSYLLSSAQLHGVAVNQARPLGTADCFCCLPRVRLHIHKVRHCNQTKLFFSPLLLQNDAGASLRQGYCDGGGWWRWVFFHARHSYSLYALYACILCIHCMLCIFFTSPASHFVFHLQGSCMLCFTYQDVMSAQTEKISLPMCVSSILIHPEIPRGLFPFLHPPHGAWQHKQGLHPTKGPYKSPLQVDLDQLKELKSKNMQSAQILQPAVLPRSWNPPHTQSFPCNHLHVQVSQNQFLLNLLCTDCLKYVQAPKVWSPLTVGVLTEKAQVAAERKPAGESFSGPHVRRRSLWRYFTLTSFGTLPEGMFSGGEKSLKIGFG